MRRVNCAARIVLQIASALLITELGYFSVEAQADSGRDACSNAVKDIPISKIKASAGIWANFRGKAGSISFESNAIFEKAKDAASNLSQPPSFCPTGCEVSKRAVLFFRSVPNKVKIDDEDIEYCRGLQVKTERSPIQYQTTDLKSVDDLNDWISELSQGDGTFGENLYEKCDRSCSPRFEYTVALRDNAPGSYLVRASIQCGEARDKDDDLYNLEAFFRWECVKP